MKVIILIICSITLLAACETMNKYVIPPDWQSMDAFKKSLSNFNSQSRGAPV